MASIVRESAKNVHYYYERSIQAIRQMKPILMVVVFGICLFSVSVRYTASAEESTWEPWSKSRPWMPGERYEAIVPDTLDLAYRAELGINATTGIIDMDKPGRGEIFVANVFNGNPPWRLHFTSCAAVLQPKVTEPLPLLRVMTGSALNLSVEKEMIAWMTRGLSRDDGLLYSLAKPDRPWFDMDCEWLQRCRDVSKGTAAVGEKYAGADVDHAYIYGQIRMMKFMVNLYQYTKDPIWKQRIDKMVEGIDEKMCRHKVDPATREKYAYMPSGAGITEDYHGSCMGRSGWQKEGREPGAESDSANEGSVFMDLGPYPGALAQWYQMTGNRRALRLAHEFANFMMMKKFWGTNSDPLGRERSAEAGHWEGHFFGRLEAMKGLLEYAVVTDNAAIKEFVRGAYKWAKISNTWPSFHNPPTPIPAIGYFDAHCGCTTARMIAVAIMLSDAGIGDYWDDVDRYTRNNLVEFQLVDPTIVRKIVETKPTWIIRSGIDNTDRVLERSVGLYPVSGSPVEILLPEYAFGGGCCLCHGNYGLYYAWEGIVRCDKGVATVNLLLNRASPWLDVDSYLPYDGKVVIYNKSAKKLVLRVPEWVDNKAVQCVRNGKPVDFTWAGNYLLVNGLRKKDTITVKFPMVERTEQYHGYTIKFRGNTVVDISPRQQTGGYPIYIRDYMMSDKPQMKKVTRYVSPKTVKWWARPTVTRYVTDQNLNW